MSHIKVPLQSYPSDTTKHVASKWHPILRVAFFIFSCAAVAASTVAIMIKFKIGNTSVNKPLQQSSDMSQLDTALIDVFDKYIIEHNKSYQSFAEYLQRFENFQRSYLQIQNINSGGYEWEAGLNHFSDWNDEETASLECYRHSENSQENMELYESYESSISDDEVPASFDWREKGCKQKIRNQERCGSCWAFSVAEAMAGSMCAQTAGKVQDVLSVQQFLDCDHVDLACNGGLSPNALEFAENGVCTEDSYPYEGHKDASCKTCNPVVKATKPKRVHGSVIDVQKAIMENGPISAAVDANTWKFYSRGVMSTHFCGSTLNHAILIVGWVRDESDGKGYWIIQNSWTERWGESGYMRLSMDITFFHPHGACGILKEVVYDKVTLL